MADPVTWTMIALSAATGIASGIAKYNATDTAINEQIGDNSDQSNLYKSDTTATLQSGMNSMQSLATENQYNVGVAAEKAQLSTGTTKAKLGYSGVTGASPLAVLQQQERQASEGVSAATASANNAMTTKGLETSLLTQGYQRKIALLEKNTKYLNDNRNKMNWLSAFGAVPETIQTTGNWISRLA